MKEQGNDQRIYSKAINHPLITGGLILAGAGLAYATVKTMKSTTTPKAREVHFETSVTINKTPNELYSFWRDLKNLPLFMKHLESVTELDDKRTHWIATGAGGVKVEWDAEIFNEIENQLISWRSLESADVVNAGTVRFQPAPGDRGTFVRVTVNYNPPGGKAAASLASLFGSDPAQLIKDDLRRLKQLFETGEIATVDGQSSGRATEEVLGEEQKAASEETVNDFTSLRAQGRAV